MKTLTRQEEQLLLAIYHLKESAYLVNIREKLKEMTGRYLDVGTINKPLKRLEREGFLNSQLGDPTPVRGGKAIKYYTLSENAYEALEEVKALHNKIWDNVTLPYKTR